MSEGLVYVGKILSLDTIPNADFLYSATVVCGKGGKWKGVVVKTDFRVEDICKVYLPDAQIPETPGMEFMASTHWRVKMRRFRGAPSEVVIMPLSQQSEVEVGDDLTELFGVTKYVKPVPASLVATAKGDFPSFIPKTDEPNYQRVPELIELLKGHRYYVTEKADGSSTTAYKWKGEFGVCSRNLELYEGDNGYWELARKHDVECRLPEGFAIQWETCGPKIQKNPMGFSEVTALAFSVYDIASKNYLEAFEFFEFCQRLKFPTVRILAQEEEDNFCITDLQSLAKGNYENGKTREGVVVRSWEHINDKMISFKVINLDYET